MLFQKRVVGTNRYHWNRNKTNIFDATDTIRWFCLWFLVTLYKTSVKLFNIQIYNRLVWLIVFNATFNNISTTSWWSVVLVEETRVPEENHPPVAGHWQIMFIEYTSPEWDSNAKALVVISTVSIDSTDKSNYHTTTTVQNIQTC